MEECSKESLKLYSPGGSISGPGTERKLELSKALYEAFHLDSVR